MNRTKRGYTRGEKALFLAPLLIAAMAGVWKWRESGPVSLRVGQASDVRSLSFSPDGTRLLVLFRELDSPTPFAGRIYEVASGATVAELEKPPLSPSPNPVPTNRRITIRRAFWSPEGRLLFTLSESDAGARLKVFQSNGSLVTERFVTDSRPDWSPNSQKIAVVTKKQDEPMRVEMVQVQEAN